MMIPAWTEVQAHNTDVASQQPNPADSAAAAAITIAGVNDLMVTGRTRHETFAFYSPSLPPASGRNQRAVEGMDAQMQTTQLA